MRKGIDVSNYQHPYGTPIDYPAVKGSGIDWCAVLMGDGLHFTNPYRLRDADGFRSVGIETCAYFFGRPEQGDPEGQAYRFAELVKDAGPFSKLILDVETGVPLSWDAISTWIHRFETKCLFDLFYSNEYYLTHLSTITSFPRWTVWAARPGDQANTTGAAVVQYGQGAVPGISGAVDLNNVWYDRAVPQPKAVAPMFDPPITIVASVASTSGKGGWNLLTDGGVFTFGDAQFYGAPIGKPYWAGRKPAQIRLSVEPGKVYDVVDTAGEAYSYPE